MSTTCFDAPRRAHILVMAKAPAPGRVKTRLCPPLSHHQAAAVAEAALADTLDAVARCGAEERVLALDGDPGLQIGMDTPQVSADLLDRCLEATFAPGVTASLGLAGDGGWWAVGLSAGWELDVFSGVPMSTPVTGRAQLDRLTASGHRVAHLPVLSDLDVIDDARRVARVAPAWPEAIWDGTVEAAICVLGSDEIVALPVGRSGARRPASGCRLSVFGPVPDPGRWATALLLDGNIGIGGDPVTLLARIHRLLRPEGRVFVEVEGPEMASRRFQARVRHAGGAGRRFPWASVGAADIASVAARSGFVTDDVWCEQGRWFAELRRSEP